MSRLDEFATSIPQTIADLESSFADLQTAANAIAIKGKGVHDRWKAYLDDQQQQITAAEAAINKLSNGLPSQTVQTTNAAVNPAPAQTPAVAATTTEDEAAKRMRNVLSGHSGTVL